MTATKAPGRPAPSARAHLTLAEGLRALDKGTLSAEAWAQACLERIAQRNQEVKAWVHVAGEAALAQARAIDRRGAGLYGRTSKIQGEFSRRSLGTSDRTGCR